MSVSAASAPAAWGECSSSLSICLTVGTREPNRQDRRPRRTLRGAAGREPPAGAASRGNTGRRETPRSRTAARTGFPSLRAAITARRPRAAEGRPATGPHARRAAKNSARRILAASHVGTGSRLSIMLMRQPPCRERHCHRAPSKARASQPNRSGGMGQAGGVNTLGCWRCQGRVGASIRTPPSTHTQGVKPKAPRGATLTFCSTMVACAPHRHEGATPALERPIVDAAGRRAFDGQDSPAGVPAGVL